MSVAETDRREYVEDSSVIEKARQIDLLRSDLSDQKALDFSQWLMYFETLTIYEICLSNRRTSDSSQIDRSRVESDLSDFRFYQWLTRFHDRVESFVSHVILRSRVDSEWEERRLSRQCSILKNLLRSAMLFFVWSESLISTTSRFVSQFVDYYSARISDQSLLFFES
jgi:hypothetical protein